MNKNSKKNNIMSSLAWTFGERIFAQIVTIIVTVILARLLAPEIYGVISIVMVFISFCNVFVTGGFGIALVQKKEVDSADYNTGFWLSLFFSSTLYLIMFALAPMIAEFYDKKELVLILRVMLLKLPLSSFNTIQQAYVQRKMQFKLFFISTSIGTICSGILGILLAYCGFGVWALVLQSLSNSTIDTIILNFVSGWKPKLEFSKKKAKEIYSFAWKMLLSELISNMDTNIKSLIIGKSFGPSSLAYFDQGQKYSALLVTNVNTAITKVMLPVYSRMQDDSESLKEAMRKTIRIGGYILAPILIGFACVADDFIKIFLTEKWLPATIYIRIFCVAYLTRPMETACMQAILALGRSDIRVIILSVINFVSLILTLVVAIVYKQAIYIALISLVCSLISTICFMFYTKKLLNYKGKEQFSDLFLLFISIIIMSSSVFLVGKLNLNLYVGFLLKIIVGIITYGLTTSLFKVDGYTYVLSKLKK